MKLYEKDGVIAGGVLVIPEENRKIVNAREQQWLHYGWTPYTPPVTEPTREERIAELKRQLNSTDYMALKHAEGWLSDDDYAPMREQRQQWREQINELESETAETVNEEEKEAE